MAQCFLILLCNMAFATTTSSLSTTKTIVVNENDKRCDVKCPVTEEPLCARIKKRNSTHSINVMMLNKCEMENMKCHQDMEAAIIPMKYCEVGHKSRRSKEAIKRRYKRDLTGSAEKPLPVSGFQKKNQNGNFIYKKKQKSKRDWFLMPYDDYKKYNEFWMKQMKQNGVSIPDVIYRPNNDKSKSGSAAKRLPVSGLEKKNKNGNFIYKGKQKSMILPYKDYRTLVLWMKQMKQKGVSIPDVFNRPNNDKFKSGSTEKRLPVSGSKKKKQNGNIISKKKQKWPGIPFDDNIMIMPWMKNMKHDEYPYYMPGVTIRPYFVSNKKKQRGHKVVYTMPPIPPDWMYKMKQKDVSIPDVIYQPNNDKFKYKKKKKDVITRPDKLIKQMLDINAKVDLGFFQGNMKYHFPGLWMVKKKQKEVSIPDVLYRPNNDYKFKSKEKEKNSYIKYNITNISNANKGKKKKKNDEIKSRGNFIPAHKASVATQSEEIGAKSLDESNTDKGVPDPIKVNLDESFLKDFQLIQGDDGGETKEPNWDEYNKDCPKLCPIRTAMVCARCEHGVYRTFPSECHMRMYNCRGTEPKMELVSRMPCAASAPYLQDMKVDQLVSEPNDDDQVLRYIHCRERGLGGEAPKELIATNEKCKNIFD